MDEKKEIGKASPTVLMLELMKDLTMEMTMVFPKDPKKGSWLAFRSATSTADH